MNRKNDFLKILAVLLMLIDHIGAVFFPENLLFRVVGRLSFPLFAYCIAEGYFYTSSWKKYSLRLFLFALISQAPYSMLFDTWRLNIFFTLWLSLLAIHCFAKKNYIAGALLLGIAYVAPISYGIFGVLLPSVYFFLKNNRILLIATQLVTTYLYSMSIDVTYQMTSVLATFLIWYTNSLPVNISMNKYLFYWFYPLHLILLYLAAHL